MKNRFEIGEAFETTVVAVTDTTVFIDLNAKSEGLVDAAEFSDENGKTSVKEGDKITVFFAGETNDEMHFTTKIAGNKSDTTMLENAYKGGIPVEGHVQAEIKGGYEIKLGNARAFCRVNVTPRGSILAISCESLINFPSAGNEDITLSYIACASFVETPSCSAIDGICLPYKIPRTILLACVLLSLPAGFTVPSSLNSLHSSYGL